MVEGNDGGGIVTLDGGQTWSSGRWSGIQAEMARIKEHDLAAFEARLRKAGLPADILPWRPGSPPPPRVSVGRSQPRH